MTDTVPILKATARGLEVYGLREYVSIISSNFRTPTQRERPDQAGAQWVYNFKKHNRDAERVELLVRGLAAHLGCDAIAAVPGSGLEPNNLQVLFGAAIKRVKPVESRKRKHSAKLPKDYAKSYTIDAAAFSGKKRVLLIDDVTSTNVTLAHFVEALKAKGIEATPAALGLNYRLEPKPAGAMTIKTDDTAAENVGTSTRARVEAVADMLVVGLQRRQIAAKVKDWKCSARTLDRYIRGANEILDKQARPLRQREFSKAVQRLEMLFSACVKDKAYKTALSVQCELNQLLNLQTVAGADNVAKPDTTLKIVRLSPPAALTGA